MAFLSSLTWIIGISCAFNAFNLLKIQIYEYLEYKIINLLIIVNNFSLGHSHSIVPGSLEVMS